MVAPPLAPAGEGKPVRALIVVGGPARDAVAAGLRDAGFAGEVVMQERARVTLDQPADPNFDLRRALA
jgi:hypothetical protein